MENYENYLKNRGIGDCIDILIENVWQISLEGQV
jgi:hypothetical protein